MRLPFGKYTETEILDTLEVIAHERVQDLRKKAGVLNEAFIDYETRAVLRTNAQGQQVVVSETVTSIATPVISSESETPPTPNDGEPAPVETTVDERAKQVELAAATLEQPIARRTGAPQIMVPVLRMSTVRSSFTLADITEADAFRKLGMSLGADPEGELSRTVVSARVITGPDGMRRTELVTSDAADRVRSTPTLFPSTNSDISWLS